MQDTEEIWKDVVGYEGKYQVSNKGRVKSLQRTRIAERNRIAPIKERILKQAPGGHGSGYLSVRLCREIDKPKTHPVHRLVAKHFINPIHGKNVINHIDSNSRNNRVENLEWCTFKENSIHYYNSGRAVVRRGENHHYTKLSDLQVLEIRANKTLTNMQLSHIYKVSDNHIRHIKQHKTRKILM